MSALPLKTDMLSVERDVRFVPKADLMHLTRARQSYRSYCWWRTILGSDFWWP